MKENYFYHVKQYSETFWTLKYKFSFKYIHTQKYVYI